MDEIGIDISAVFDLFKSGQFFPYVILFAMNPRLQGVHLGKPFRLGWLRRIGEVLRDWATNEKHENR